MSFSSISPILAIAVAAILALFFIKPANAATFGGAATAATSGWWTQDWIGMWAGIAIGVIGILMNYWFKMQYLKLAQKDKGDLVKEVVEEATK